MDTCEAVRYFCACSLAESEPDISMENVDINAVYDLAKNNMIDTLVYHSLQKINPESLTAFQENHAKSYDKILKLQFETEAYANISMISTAHIFC